jgi:hypothetical protein
MKPNEDMQAAIDAAWRLVRECGLEKSAFDSASVDCIKDALWLIGRGVPAAEVIEIMNTEAYAGQETLRSLRAKKALELRRSFDANWNPGKSLAAAHLAALLGKLDVWALIGEVKACLLTEKDPQRIKLVFLEILRLQLVLRRRPEMKAALDQLRPSELQDLYFDAAITAQTIRELVGSATVTEWLA